MSLTLTQWAQRHGVSSAALAELVNYVAPPLVAKSGQSEAAVLANVRMEASAKGARLWRNNIIACVDSTGRMVRGGLLNESKQQNETIKSSDLIGIMPVLITPEHVGTTIGQFVARECKAGSWKWSGSSHEVAQMRFIDLVNSLGGDAAMVNSVWSL